MAALSHVDSRPRGVVVLDKSSIVTSANQRAAEIFGVPLEDLVGSPLQTAAISGDAHSRDTVHEEVIDKDSCDSCVLHRYSAPVLDSSGEILGRVEIYSDITARRELEKEIVQRNSELAELNRRLREAQEQLLASERLRTMGEMAAGVAHDINNVLGIILGNTQLARRKCESNDEALACMDAIEMAARDAAETVRRLREIGKPTDTAAYKEADLSRIADEAVKATAPTWAGAKGSQCRIDIQTHLAPDCVILGRPCEIRQALANVLLNAAQAIEGKGKIVVTTTAHADYIDVSVSDNGCGMSKETQMRIFDPFFTTRGAAGTGLGMNMVDATVMRHQGKVLVESEEGKGTTVTLRFPRSQSQHSCRE